MLIEAALKCHRASMLPIYYTMGLFRTVSLR